MDMLRFPRGTRNDFQGSRKDSKSSILGTSSVAMVPFPIYGSSGTKEFLGGFQDRKFSKFFGGSTSALGDYEVVYSVWWLRFNSVE